MDSSIYIISDIYTSSLGLKENIKIKFGIIIGDTIYYFVKDKTIIVKSKKGVTNKLGTFLGQTDKKDVLKYLEVDYDFETDPEFYINKFLNKILINHQWKTIEKDVITISESSYGCYII